MHRSVVLASILGLLVACSKSQSPPPTAESAAISALPPAASSAPAASAAPTTSASTAPPDSTTLAAADSAAKSATAPKETGAKAGDGADSGACGTKPLPDCPLQAWMKKNMNPPSLSGDTAALAVAFDKLSTMAPAGYTNWASIAKDGGSAAKSGNLDAAKNACRSCHDQYKKKYRAEIRGRKI